MTGEWIVCAYADDDSYAPFVRSFQYTFLDAFGRAVALVDLPLADERPVHHVTIVNANTGAGYTLTAGAD